MLKLIARFRAWRKHRRAERLALDYLRNDRLTMVKIYAALRFAEIDGAARVHLNGTELACIYCRRIFRYDNKTCTLGFCPRCSK